MTKGVVVRGWEEENWKEESSYGGLPQESIKGFPLRTSFHTISFQIKALTFLNHISSLTPFKENVRGKKNTSWKTEWGILGMRGACN